jgi:hypothetical protein
MSLVQNNVSLLVNQQDGTSGVNLVNRSSGVISYNGVAGEFDKRTLAADTANHAFDLPATNVLQFYFKNTHLTAVITLIGTVQGGSSQTLAKVQPGGVFCYWAPVTAATAGYTALSYTSDTASATAEVFLGG